ncbi:MAG: hypothetical protein CBR30_06425 [Dictyoglomus sp. NZ13-RE01]|nr:MAG: hypothetical protein CBR30_06425 [Dictyoglomus sp. NZ13-RE01]
MNLKLSFDLLTIEVFYKENYNRIINSLVEKIYQIGNTEVILDMYSPQEGRFLLILSVHPKLYRIQISNIDLPYPSTPPPFCMFLRKHIEGAKIVDWKLIPKERILEFTFQRVEEEKKKLIVELMGKYSNIILVNENNVILDAIKHVSSEKNRYREILPQQIYLYPPKINKISLLDIKEDEIEKLLEKENIKDVLVKEVLYITPLIGEEITQNPDRNIVKKRLLELKEKIIKNEYTFLVYFLENKPYTYSLFPLTILSGLKYKVFNTLTETVDFIYSYALENYLLEQYKKRLREIIENNLEKLQKKREELLEAIKEGESAESLKIKGETLILYQKDINRGPDKVILPNPYNEKELLEIDLDPALSPIDNAQRYFKRYKKLKKGINILKEQLEKVENEIFYLNSLDLSLENSNKYGELQEIEEELISSGYIREKRTKKKTQKRSQPYKFLLPGGYEVYVGKNNKQNDYITFNIASPEDLWFHARGIPGAHVILKTKSKEEVPQEIIEYTAEIAGYFSKGRNSSYVAIDYTKRKYVQKPKDAKPGFVIYKNEKTIFVKPENALQFISQLV